MAGIFDAILGQTDFQARGAKVGTYQGTQALQNRAQMQGQQMQGQQYGLAASAGGFSPLAIREAQRRSAMGQAQLGQQSLEQQRMLEQQAAMANQQSAMQAQGINAQIAQSNAQGLQKGIGAMAGAAAMASDVRAKENVTPYRMLSDFMAKEDIRPGSYMPQQAKPGVDPAAFSNREVQLELDRRREAAFDRENAMMAAAADQGAGAVQMLGVSPEQARQAQMLRDSNQSVASAAQGSPAYGPAAGMQQPQPSSWQMAGDTFARTMASDFAAKEDIAALEAGQQRALSNIQVPTARYPDMSPEQAQAALAPVQPYQYSYRPEAAARMASEQASSPGEAAMVYQDKRAPRTGIIAQELEQSPAFRPAVVETPAGKAVDRDRATSVNLAATAGLEKRQTQLEDEISRLKRLLGEGEKRALEGIDRAGRAPPKARGAR
jgi:hypothetical protein